MGQPLLFLIALVVVLVSKVPAAGGVPDGAHGADFLTEDPRRARVLVLEAQDNQALQERRQLAKDALVDIFVSDPTGAPDPPLSIDDRRLAALALVGGAWDLITTWLRGRLPDINRDHLVDFIVAYFTTALGLPDTLYRQPPSTDGTTPG